jgi:long-chain acyl-CoA synthetase
MNEGNLIITEYFSQIARKSSGRVCLQIKKGSVWERWTYGQLKERALKVAGFLISSGFKKGDFACLILENCPDWPAIYLGIVAAGLSCVPLDPQLSSEEIKNLILDSGAKVVFTSSEIFAQKLKQAIEQTEVKAIVLETDEIKIKNTSYNDISWPEVNPGDIASLIYTSGTTGKPKGILLTHENLCSNFQSIQKLNLCFSSDNVLSILPLYHSYAFMVTLIVPLFLGAKVTYALSFKSQEFSQIIGEASVTILVGVPQLFSLLHKAIFERIKKIPSLLRPLVLPFIRIGLQRKFGSLRLSVSGGARLEPKIAKDLTRLGLKLIEGYGLTETSPVATINPPERIKFGSVGKPIPDVEIKIFNPDKKGVGEVLIKGPNVMEGYFKQPELTAQVIKDDWLYSGDLGYIDKEGYLYLVGREKEVIVLASGKNIYPEELEEYYLRSPYIKEICITHKQERIFGYLKDSLFAVIIPDLEYFNQKKELNIREKIRWDLETLGKKLAPYQHIMGFTLTKEELPRTRLGKIKRYAVREKYLQEKPSVEIEKMVFSEEDLAILNKDIAKSIIQYVSKEVNKPVNLDSHLEIDLGIDSLTRVELGLGLEAIFKIKIPDELLYKISTIKDVIINLEELIEGAKPKVQKAKEKTWSEILKEPPPEEIIEKIKIGFAVFESALTWLVKNIFLFIFRLFWFLRVEGSENLPKKGPYLVCPNHASYLDGFFIFLSLPFKRSLNTYFLGYQRIFEYPLLGWANKICRLISIDTDSHLALGMQAVSFVLSHKKIVCVFPEGMRSIDKEVKEFKKGVGILLKELDIPAIPVYIQGSHQSWPRGRRIPRFYPIRVIFGKPLYAKQLSDDYEAIAKRLRGEVLKLIPKNAKS